MACRSQASSIASPGLAGYLAVTGRPHSRESLAGLLWGEMSDEDAKANLRKILSVLRNIAAPNLEIGRQVVAFNRDSNYWLDTEVFESKLEYPTATSITPVEMQDRHVELLDEAVQLYTGDFLEGFYVRDAPAFEEWVLPERERLQQKMQQHSTDWPHTIRPEGTTPGASTIPPGCWRWNPGTRKSISR